MRYTGEYQIRQSREEELTIELGLAGCFPAFPGDTVRLELGAMGLSGEYRGGGGEAEATASPETGRGLYIDTEGADMRCGYRDR